MTRTFHPAASLLATTAMALTLSACKIDNRPLLARGEPAPIYAAGAPAPGPLDPGDAAPVAYLPPAQAYAYPERAYAMSRVVRQRPPSYAFGYGDEQPWVWDAADQGLMFAEPVDDSWRYYYYESGDAYPYFVQDPDYGYAYGDNGALLALFDAAGALIAANRYDDYAPRASSYWTRAYDLNRTYWRSPRYPVRESVWRERAPGFVSAHDRWFRAASAQPYWDEAQRHDNGRHLGWYKDPGEKEARREARQDRGPPQAHGPQQLRHEDRPQRDRGPKAGREARGGPAFARAAENHGGPQGRPQQNHPGGGPQGGGGGGHGKGGGQGGGGGGHDKGGGGGGGHDKGGGQGGGGHGHGH